MSGILFLVLLLGIAALGALSPVLLTIGIGLECVARTTPERLRGPAVLVVLASILVGEPDLKMNLLPQPPSPTLLPPSTAPPLLPSPAPPLPPSPAQPLPSSPLSRVA